MEPEILVVAAVIVRAGRVLLTQRDPLRNKSGWLWECPGGKVEEGEMQEGALARELREELGVDVVVGDRIDRFTFGEVARPKWAIEFFRVDRWEGHPLPKQAVGIGWFSADDLYGLTMTRGNQRFRVGLAKLLEQEQYKCG